MLELIALLCFAIAIIAMVVAPAATSTVAKPEVELKPMSSRSVTQTA